MLSQSAQRAILHSLNVNTPCSSETLNIQTVGGGSMNDTYRILLTANQYFFCKVNSATKFPHLFDSECRGLFLIQQQNVIGTPRVIDSLVINDQQILLLEYIEQGERTPSFWDKFGGSLAQMHQSTNEFFGLDDDNYMGSVPQSNKPTNNWINFFYEQRLQPLVDHCSNHHLLPAIYRKQFDQLNLKLSAIFDTD